MEIKSEHVNRLETALGAADEAFWAVIAERFPEATTGDYPPDLTWARENHNKEDLLWWLRFNAPKLLEGEGGIEKGWFIAYFEAGPPKSMFGYRHEVHDAYPGAIQIDEA